MKALARIAMRSPSLARGAPNDKLPIENNLLLLLKSFIGLSKQSYGSIIPQTEKGHLLPKQDSVDYY